MDDSEADWGREIVSLPHSSLSYSLAMTPDGRYSGGGNLQGFTIWEGSAGPDGLTCSRTWNRPSERGRFS